MLRIVGHRGARGLTTENTLESIQKAIDLGVDSVEFDVRTSKDGVPIVHHDDSLRRMTGVPKNVSTTTYSYVKNLKTLDGQSIPTAREVIAALGSTPFLLEIKDRQLKPAVLRLLEDIRSKDFAITSFRHPIIARLKKQHPKLKLYAATHVHPLETIRFAAKHNLDGVTIDWKSFTPVIYWLARRKGLEIKLFTVNNALYMRLLGLLNLKLDVITDYPDRAIRILR